MIRRLRVKFVCINMVTVTVMLCVILGMVLHFTRQSLEDKSVRLLQTLAAEPVQPGLPGRVREVQLPYFTVELNWQGDMRVAGAGSYSFLDEGYLAELLSAAMSAGEPIGVLPEYGLRYCRSGPPGGQKFVFVDISSEVSTMQNLLRSCLLIGCAGFLAFLLVSLLLARWAVQPVDAAWKQQRQFVADASHELKTPLTVILTNAELLQESGPSPFAGNILVMARQMRGLIENLLDLARVDSGLAEKTSRPVDLSRLASDALLPFEPVFFEGGLALETEIAEGIAIQGSPDHLRQVVEILLDNAGKYGEGTVSVRLERVGGKSCLLSVASRGASISKEDLRNIFKRFYRVDEARSRDGSYGLGLSIAEGIVQAHRGRIWAESEGGINTFFAPLPVDKEKTA